jgi:hypothetical protein
MKSKFGGKLSNFLLRLCWIISILRYEPSILVQVLLEALVAILYAVSSAPFIPPAICLPSPLDQHAACCLLHAGFSLGLPFDSEDGGDVQNTV